MAADGNVKIDTSIDQSGAVKGMRQLSILLKGMAGSIAAAFSVTAIAKFGMASIKAYGESKRSVDALSASLKAVGITSDVALKEFQHFATSMQEFSGISDEVIIDCLRLATNFGIFGKQAEDTVRSAHALSLGLGMDLNSAMMLLVRASEGHTETLARYGLSIEKTGDKAKDFATLIKTVDDKFGSLAGANVDNAITKTNALKESFNDLMEVVGQKLTPLFNFIAKRLKDTFDGINILIGMSKEESDYLRLLRNEENLLKDIERAKSQGTTDFLPMWEKQLASIKEQLEVHRAINREENARKTLMGELAKKQELEAVKVKEAAELRVEQEKALTEKLNKELEDVNKKSLNVMASQVNDYLQQRANDEKLYGDKRIQFYKDEVQRLTQ